MKSIILAVKNPLLTSEWNLEKNYPLTPHDVSFGSNKKIWWKCIKGHEWQEIINNRSKGRNCPYCSGKRVCIENCLSTCNPILASEWDYMKNGVLTPNDVTYGSNKKVSWRCKAGHSWMAIIASRNIGNGCPFCSNKYASKPTCLATINPVLSYQWHNIKNGSFTPFDVTPGSGKKVWWNCCNGHEWKATVKDRSDGAACPYCAGKILTHKNCLSTVNPVLTVEWNYKKNDNLTPTDVFPNSDRSIWWICNKGHEWEANIGSRNTGVGCPYCNKEKQTSFAEQSIFFYLKMIFTDAENGKKFKSGNAKYEADIYIPSIQLCVEYDSFHYHNSVSKINKDREKNSFFHSEAITLIRVRENGLPQIADFQCINIERYNNKSFQSLDECIVNLLEQIMVIKTCKSMNLIDKIDNIIKYVNTKEHNKEIYVQTKFLDAKNSLTSKNTILSGQWHPTRNLPLTPNFVSNSSGIQVWWKCNKGHEWQEKISNRNTHRNCPYCSGHRVCIDNCLATRNPQLAEEWHHTKNIGLTPYHVTCGSSKKVWWRCKKGHEWESTVNNRASSKTCPYCSGHRTTIESCLETTHPQIISLWHKKKNGLLTPLDVSHGSNKKVWWTCENDHEWQEAICNIIKGYGCPYCSGRKVCNDNCLKTLKPIIASQWHPLMNCLLTPADITCNSSKKVWWLCEKGHKWEARVYSRTKGNGCPYCSNQIVYDGNCLAINFPDIAKQWHPFKNGNLTPFDVTFCSHKKVYWIDTTGNEKYLEVRYRTSKYKTSQN